MNKLPPTAASLLAQAREEDRAHRVDVEASLAALTASLPFADAVQPVATQTATGAAEAGLGSASGLGTAHGALFAGKGIKLFLATVALGGAIGGGAWVGLEREPRRAAGEVQQLAPAAKAKGAPVEAAHAAPLPEPARPASPAERAAAPTLASSSAAARARAQVRTTARAQVVRAELPSQPAQPNSERASPIDAAQAPKAEVPVAADAREDQQSARPVGPLELDLIDDALRSLRADAAQVALSKLELHEQLFRHGKFSVERRGLRVLALCRLGRDEQARRERSVFLTAHADAPIAARVRKACSDEGER